MTVTVQGTFYEKYRRICLPFIQAASNILIIVVCYAVLFAAWRLGRTEVLEEGATSLEFVAVLCIITSSWTGLVLVVVFGNWRAFRNIAVCAAIFCSIMTARYLLPMQESYTIRRVDFRLTRDGRLLSAGDTVKRGLLSPYSVEVPYQTKGSSYSYIVRNEWPTKVLYKYSVDTPAMKPLLEERLAKEPETSAVELGYAADRLAREAAETAVHAFARTRSFEEILSHVVTKQFLQPPINHLTITSLQIQ